MYVYILIDSKRKLIGYVGITNNPEMRYLQHLRDTRYGNAFTYPVTTSKQNWISYLASIKEIPQMIIIERCEDRYDASLREKQWIAKLIKKGHPITNGELSGVPYEVRYSPYFDCPYTPAEQKAFR
jgi:predicted GIY-YIG superfamily endonuclease